MKFLSILTAVFAFVCCNAEVIDLTEASVWQPLDNVLFHGKTITGRASPGLYRFNQWPHDVNKARLVLLLDWTNKNALVEIKNAALTIK